MVYSPQFGKTTTLAAQMTAGEVTSATLASSVFTNFTADFLVIDYDVPAKREVIKCNVSGTAISAITRAQEGTSAVQHEIGAKVAYNFLPSHYEDLKANGVLGYEENTGSFSTTTVGSFVDVTSLEATVTVPSGGRRVKITAWLPQVSSSGADQQLYVAIREGNTVLQQGNITQDKANYKNIATVIAVITPTAGSHTYKVSVYQASAGTLAVADGSNTKAFISVEYLGGV